MSDAEYLDKLEKVIEATRPTESFWAIWYDEAADVQEIELESGETEIIYDGPIFFWSVP